MRLALLAAFIVVPLAEIFTIVQVGQVIGPWWTIALLIAVSVVGSRLVRREGRRVWQALTTVLGTGRLPDREVVDAGLVLAGGILMVTPGFFSDVVGLFAILPATRPLARRGVSWLFARQLARRVEAATRVGPSGTSPHRGPVIPGEVVDSTDDPR